MASTNLKDRQRLIREEFILETAHALIASKGYNDLSMDELAAEVGVSKTTLYQHFPSKEDLAVKVITRVMSDFLQGFNKLDTSQPAIVRLEQLLRSAIVSRAGLWSINLGPLPQKLRDNPVYRQQSDLLQTLETTLIDQAKSEGTVAPQLSTPVLVGVITRLIRDKYEDLLGTGQCTSQEISDTIVALVLNGIGPSKSNT